MYRALKECHYDKNYYPGDCIDDSVIDPMIVESAIKYGYIEKAQIFQDDGAEIKTVVKPGRKGRGGG